MRVKTVIQETVTETRSAWRRWLECSLFKTVIQETVTETRERVVSDVVTCDICGAESLSRRQPAIDFDGTINWLDEETAEYDTTTISRDKGIGSVENGRSLTEAFHVCPACWPKLATWIGSFRGAGPTLVDEDEW